MGAPVPLTGRVPASSEPARAPLPEPGFWETVGASVRVQQDEWTDAQQGRLREGYESLATALAERGVARDGLTRQTPWFMLPAPGGSLDYGKVFEAARAQGLTGLPATQEEYEQGLLTRGGARQRDQQIAARGGMAPALIGSALSDMADSDLGALQFMVGTSSRSVFAAMLKEGGLNLTLEGVKTPERLRNREALGETMSGVEVAGNLVGAFAAGAAFTAAGRGLSAANRKFWTTSAGERIKGESIAALWDVLPQGTRDRLAASATIDDDVLAELAEAAVPPGQRSEVETAAINLFQSEQTVRAGSPYLPGGSAEAVHRRLLGEALARIAGDAPDSPPAPRQTGRVAMRQQTAIASEVVPGDAQARFMARVRVAESSGNDAAVPRSASGRVLSSAVGRYQFIRSTWLHYYKRRFGSGGLSDDQILGLRTNGQLQDLLMADLTADNAAFLRARGEAVTEGNLYLAHFAGQGGARKLFDAAPDTPVERVLTPDAITANPWLRGKTAQGVIDWAHAKMGQRAGARGHGVTVAPEQAGSRAGALQAEVDRITAQIAELDAAATRAGDAPVPAEAEAVPVEPIGDFEGMEPLPGPMADRPPLEPAAADAVPPPVETMAILPELRRIVDERKRSLNDTAKLARLLNTSEEEVRKGLDSLVNRGELRRSKKTGLYARPAPRGTARSYDSEELLNFIASKGGIRDDEGHALGLVGVSARERRELDSNMIRNTVRDRKRRGTRNWKRMTPAGPLLRHEGMDIDTIGQTLQDWGYFPSSDIAPRPTLNEVLDLIERAINGEKIYPIGHPKRAAIDDGMDEASLGYDPDGPPPRDVQVSFYRQYVSDVARTEFGIDELDPDFTEYAAELMVDLGLTERDAFIRAVNFYAQDVADEAFELSGGARYDEVDYEWPFDDPPYRSEDFADEGDFAGYEPTGADAATWRGGGGPDGEGQGPAGPPLADIDPAELTRFIDPEGDSARVQAESLEHDARAVVDAARQLYHGTRGERQPENPNGLGLTFYGESEAVARRYAEGAGGRRAADGEPRIDTVEAPTAEQTLDITTREGLEVLASLEPASRIAQIVVADAKKDLADRLQTGAMVGLRANTSFWGFTKSISANDAAGFRADIVDALAARGYRAIRFNDDMHVSVGVFDQGPPRGDAPAPVVKPDDAVREALRAQGWSQNNDSEFSLRIEGYAPAGSFSNGARVVTVRINWPAKRVERIGGWGDVEESVSFADIEAGLDAALARVIYKGSALESRMVPPEAPAASVDAGPLDAAPLDRGAAVDPNADALARQRAQLGAQAPMRARTEQDGTMGLALFDQADQPGFLLDADGKPMDLKGLLDSLDAEQTDFDTIRGCMVPKPKGDA